MATTRRLFVDTSALVKYVHDEAGSDRVIDLIEDENHDVCISERARVEFASALHRKRREGALSDSQLQQALSGFDEVLSSLRVEPIGPRVVEVAVQRIRAHGKETALRTLDALRELIVENYRVIDQLREGQIEIITVVHSRRPQNRGHLPFGGDRGVAGCCPKRSGRQAVSERG